MKLWIEVPENTKVINYTYVHERDNGDTLQISEARLKEQEIADHVVEEAENRIGSWIRFVAGALAGLLLAEILGTNR